MAASIDLSILNEDIEKYDFVSMSKKILFNFSILTSTNKYRIGEIEFYCYDDVHPDLYTHCHADQSTYGHWYFHKFGTTYKSGTFKGLDITLGKDGRYFGILIRSIIDDGKIIEGPCLTVNKFLNDYGFSKVEELTNYDLLSIDDDKLKLIYDPIEESTIYNGKRYGLKLKDKDNDGYLDKYYRFSSFKLKKKNGIMNII